MTTAPTPFLTSTERAAAVSVLVAAFAARPAPTFCDFCDSPLHDNVTCARRAVQ